MKKPSGGTLTICMAILFLSAMGFFVLFGFTIHKALGYFLAGMCCLLLALGAHEALKKKKKGQ